MPSAVGAESLEDLSASPRPSTMVAKVRRASRLACSIGLNIWNLSRTKGEGEGTLLRGRASEGGPQREGLRGRASEGILLLNGTLTHSDSGR